MPSRLVVGSWRERMHGVRARDLRLGLFQDNLFFVRGAAVDVSDRQRKLRRDVHNMRGGEIRTVGLGVRAVRGGRHDMRGMPGRKVCADDERDSVPDVRDGNDVRGRSVGVRVRLQQRRVHGGR